jgi:hypothetical protein
MSYGNLSSIRTGVLAFYYYSFSLFFLKGIHYPKKYLKIYTLMFLMNK